MHAQPADGARGLVRRSTFNLVWQHENRFRQVARENPHLLKLLQVFMMEKKLPLETDPVAAMRDYIRRHGLTDAAWRYVHRHGSRLFRDVWKVSEFNCKAEASVNYLRVLESAGFPPPPPPSLALAWFRCHVDMDHNRMRFGEDWSVVDRTVIRVVLLEADKRRRHPAFAQFVGEVVGILHWAIDTSLALNPQQTRSGWKWLIRQWGAWRASRQREDNVAGLLWQSYLPQTIVGRFDVKPIDSGTALLEEAFSMHNCADTLIDDCVAGRLRMFSVRHARNGERIATLGILALASGWASYQIKRAANRPPTPELELLATEVARLYTERSCVYPTPAVKGA